MKDTEIYYDEDILDRDFLAKLLSLYNEESIKDIIELLNKSALAFIREDDTYRQYFLESFLSKFKNSSDKFFLSICKDTLIGNVLFLYRFITNNTIVDYINLDQFKKLLNLNFIFEDDIYDLLPLHNGLCLNLDERIETYILEEDVKEIMVLVETLIFHGIIKNTRENFMSLLALYKSYENVGKFKSQVFDSLLNNDINKFISCMQKIDYKIKDTNDFFEKYTDIYKKLLEAGIVLFFDFDNIIPNGGLKNNNVFPLIYIDNNENKKILMPFTSVEGSSVKKVLDMESNKFVVPKHLFKKISIEDISSFNKVHKIKKIDQEDVNKVLVLDENSLINKISQIIKEPNKTSHGPMEKADLLTGKIFLNDDNDLRETAFIFKAKSTSTINAKEVTHQIVKAVQTNAELIILAFTGNIIDEARDNFIYLCKQSNKLYCLLDRNDLTRILLAYQLMES